MSSTSDERQLILQARQTLQDGRWAEARDLYAQVPQGVLDPAELDAARRKIERLEQSDADAQELIKHAESQFEHRDFREAYNTYTQALNQAGAAGVLKYHARLEQARYRALHLADSQDKVNRTITEAQSLGKTSQWEQALERLKRLIDEMPQGEAYETLLADLNAQREEVEKQIGAEQLYKKAVDAYKAQDWEEARKLAEAVPAIAVRSHDAQVLIAKIDEHMERYINPTVNRIKAAFEERRWPDAFSELDNLRRDFDQSRICQQWWLQVGKASGLQSLDAGREANSQREFKGAQRAFQDAATTFQKVLELHPTHTEILALRTEAQDLAQIAIAEAQAQADWDGDRFAEAVQVLEGALQRIEIARHEGRDYAAVAATARSMLAALNAEMARIEDEKLRLQTGERYLEQRRLEEARAVFAGLLNAVLPIDRAAARTQLDRAETEISGFSEALARASALQDPEKQADAYADAFTRWPTGPAALDRLLGVAERLSSEERHIPAVRAADMILEVDPQNERARVIKQRPGIADQVKIGIETANATIERLNGDADAKAADYAAIRDSLARLVEQARPYSDLGLSLEQTSKRIGAAYERLRAFEAKVAGAEQRRRAGHWDRAAEEFAQALDKFGDQAPPALGARLTQWRTAAEKTASAIRDGRESLDRARQAYNKFPETRRDLAAVESVTGPLSATLTLIQEAETACQAAGGPVPEALSKLHSEVETLKRLTDTAITALKASSARDGWATAKELLVRHSGDQTIAAIANDLHDKLLQEVPSLLSRAQEAIERGDLQEAVDLLHQARELKPDDHEISKRHTDLVRRRNLEEQLRQVEQDADDRLRSDSPIEAADALRRGIQKLLNPELGLSSESAKIIHDILAYGLGEDGGALGRPEVVKAAQASLAELGRRSSESWLAFRAHQLTESWLRQAIDNGRQSLRSSSEAQGNLIEAYVTAVAIRNAHPTDDQAISEVARILSLLIKKTCGSAGKRMEWANEHLLKGNWQAAQQELNKIESEFYEPVRKELPGLDEMPEAQAQLTQIAALQRRINSQQQLEERVLPQFSAAESAWQQNRLDDAEVALDTLPKLEEAPWFEQRRNDFLARISRARAKNALRAFKDKLAEVEVDIEDAQTVEALKAAEKKLKAITPPVGDLEAQEARERYVSATATVSARLSRLADATTFDAQASAAEQRGDYVAARRALQKAIDATIDPVKKSALLARQEELQGSAERQQDREAAENAGRSKFRQREYVAARMELHRAKDLGAQVDDLLEAAWVGELVSQAQGVWDEKKDVLAAQSLLLHALEQGKDKPEASEIMREAEALRSQVERFQADRIAQAESLLEEAKKAREARRHTAALAHIDAILTDLLPGWPKAVAQRDEITRIQKPYQTLLQAENAARKHDFQRAHDLLEDAIRLDADRSTVDNMRKQIEAVEKDWQQNTLVPIREKIEDQKYADALTLCGEASQKTLSQEFQTTLNELRIRAVNEWVTADLVTIRSEIGKASCEALQGLIDRLDGLTDRKPQEHLRRQIDQLSRNAHERLLSSLLELARQQMAKGAWEPARQSASEVKKQADTLSLGRFSWEADALVLEIETRQKDCLDQQNLEQYQKLYDEAATLQKGATGRADLELAVSRLRKALDVPGYGDDWAAKSLLAEVEAALRVFDDTAQALEQSREALFQRRTRDAETALTRLTRVSPLLSTKYDQQRGLLRSLRQAENAQESGEYALALGSYKAAVERDAAVEPLLETAIERCRERLMERQTAQVRDALEMTPPDVSHAETLLDQAVKQDWVTPSSQSKVNRLKNWVTSYKHLAQAVGDLNIEDMSADQILLTLRQARESLPEGQSDATLVQWEQLAQALKAWEADDIDNARIHLNGVLPPATEHQRAKQLADDIARASADRQAIEQGRLRVESALGAVPPRYDTAVEAVMVAMRDTNGAPAIISVRNTVAQRLQSAVKSAQENLHYTEAIRLAHLLSQLGADSAAAEPSVESLRAERDQKRAEAVARAEAELNLDHLEESDRAIQQAKVICGDEGGRDLDLLLQRLQRRKGILADTDSYLRAAHASLDAVDWESAIQAINRARTSAPNYPVVAETVAEAQTRMIAAAQTQLDDHKFDEARQLCDVAGQLGTNSILSELRDKIQQAWENWNTAKERQRMNQFIEWRKQAEAALAVWDVENADEYIKQAYGIAPEHADVPRLRAQRQRLADAVQPVKQAMERGREALLKQDYVAAVSAFDDALALVPDFKEGIQWRVYAAQLQRGVETMLASEGGSVPEAFNDLQSAEAALRVGPQDQLPAILPDVREWRRQAVYVAHCLAEAGAELVRRERSYADALRGRDLKLRVKLLNEVEAQQQTFAQIHSNPRKAPVDFSAERETQKAAATETKSRGTASGPEAREPALESPVSPVPAASESIPVPPALPSSIPIANSIPKPEGAIGGPSQPVSTETTRPADGAVSSPAQDRALAAPAEPQPDPVLAPVERPMSRKAQSAQEPTPASPPGDMPTDRPARRADDGAQPGLPDAVGPERRPSAAANEAELPERITQRSQAPDNGPAAQKPAQASAETKTPTSIPEPSAPVDEAEAAFLKKRNWGRSRITPTSTNEELR